MSDFWAFQWRNSPVSPFLYFKWTLCKWCRCLWCKSEKVQISAQTQIICAHLQLWKKFQNISYMRQGKSFFQTVWALFLSATFYMSGAVCVQIWMIENWSRGNRLFYFLIFYWNWCPQSSDSWHLCLPSLEMLSGEHCRELVWFGYVQANFTSLLTSSSLPV